MQSIHTMSNAIRRFDLKLRCRDFDVERSDHITRSKSLTAGRMKQRPARELALERARPNKITTPLGSSKTTSIQEMKMYAMKEGKL